MLFALAKAASVLDKRAAETISSWLYAAIPSILATIITATIGIFIANFSFKFRNDDNEQCRA